jgi:large subunit ribosomal protein L18
MIGKSEERRLSRLRRHRRIRKRIAGTAERPRLAVRRSLRQIYVQVVDDNAARTLVAISTHDKAAREQLAAAGSRMERSKLLGKLLAERAKENGITRVTFDRGGYLYHGHVRAVAEGAREGGLEF